jgi:hypothetical protein
MMGCALVHPKNTVCDDENREDLTRLSAVEPPSRSAFQYNKLIALWAKDTLSKWRSTFRPSNGERKAYCDLGAKHCQSN